MLVANPQILFQKLGDEAVILHLKSEQYFGLDLVGTRFWEIMTEKGNLEDTISVLLEEFEVDEATLRTDLEELISRLRAEDLLQST